MTKEQFAELFIRKFPDRSGELQSHYQSYHELLGHVFFADVINTPLRERLQQSQHEANKNPCDREQAIQREAEINQYCAFIERMWLDGDEAVKNIVAVTIIEGMDEVWEEFGRHLSKEFIWVINEEILAELAVDVPRLSMEGRR